MVQAPARVAVLAAALGALNGCIWLNDEDLAARLDLDGDGVQNADDCDPEDPAVAEPRNWYPDYDLDGYGLTGAVWTACEGAHGFTDVPGDCDDADADVNPAAVEACDGDIDGDCDGDADPPDEDGDGYTSCDGDCDTADASVHPGATDTCGDGIDSDCDSADGDCDVSTITNALTLYGAAGDEVGPVAEMIDLSGDGDADVVLGAQGATGSVGAAQGAVYLVCASPGAPGDSASLQAASALTLYGDGAADALGSSLATADLDGDGYRDLIVGAAGLDESEGAAYILAGPLGGAPVGLSDAAVRYLGGGKSQGRVGSALVVVEDGGGSDLLFIGAETERLAPDPTNIGLVYQVDGTWLPTGASGDVPLGSWADYLYGEGENDELGGRLLHGEDLDADGDPELVLCCRDCESAESLAGEGAVYIIDTLPISGPVMVEDVAVALWGGAADARAGRSCAASSDLTGDGLADLVVGAPGLDAGAGEVFLVAGDPRFDRASGLPLEDAARARLVGPEATGDVQAGLGTSVLAGDLLGAPTLVMGAAGVSAQGSATADEAGAVYVSSWTSGAPSGTTPVHDISGTARLIGEAGDRAGAALSATAPLWGGAGVPLLIGAESNSLGGSGAGAVYVLPDLAGAL